MQRGQDQHDSLAPPVRRRGASQMEQRAAPAALRKVQQPHGHWLRCRGMEPEEKLQGSARKDKL